jgi:hypothetical protein
MHPPRFKGTYWDADSRTCGNINSCQLQFAAVPIGKTLLVRRVGCVFQLPSTAKISQARLQRLNIAATVVGYEILGPVPMTSNDNSVKHYSFNAEALLVVTSSEKPAVLPNLRETAANIQMQCTLHGEITP